MPWKKAKALPPPSNDLFEACFRIQREACAAAGRYIPLVVENVCGAQNWVGRARWHYGSFYLWGDVPALMPVAKRGQNPDGRKTIGLINIRDGHGHTRHLTNQAEHDAVKNGGDWFGSGSDSSLQRRQGSKGSAREHASAHIAKIPLALARHIGRAWMTL